MFKLRSIAARLILAITFTAAVACGVLGTYSILQQRSLTRLALDQQLKLQYDSVMAALDYEGRAALAISAVIANLPPVAEAVAKQDRDALMALLGGSMKVLEAQGIPLISFHTPPATAFFRVHAPKVFGEDISARRKTVVESNQTGKPIVGVEPGRELLSVFAMTPIMRDGKSLAVADIGVSFGKQFVDSAKQRFGVDLAVYRFDGKAFANIASTLGGSVVATPDELKSAFEGGTLRRDATLNGHPAALYLGQIRNYAGQPVAVIELVKDTTEYEAAAASSQRHLIFATAAILGAAIVLAFLLGRGLSRPLTAITAVMNRLSSGDTDVTIPGGNRKDELGTMAGAVDVFRRGMIEACGRRRKPPSSRLSSRKRPCSARWPTASKPTSRAWSPPSRRRSRTCRAWPARSRPASMAPRSAPPPRRLRRKRRRSVSARSPPPPKSLPLPSPRSAVRSAIPAVSPMPPWARPCKPRKWSAA